MFGVFDKYILVFLTGLVVSYCLTPLVRALAHRFGVVDMPNERRPHKRPTARGGGLAVVISMHVACLTAMLLPWPLAGGLDFAWWQRFFLASMVLTTVGIIDDVRGMSPWIKLAGQASSAAIMWATGTRFGSFMGLPLPPWLDFLFVVGWLVLIINAFNLIDGLDGLASGLAIISAIGLCGFFIIGHLPANVLVLLGLIGACLGFLRYNFHPATIFLGDTGSMFLGFILGVVSLQTSTKSTFLFALTIPLMVIGVPVYDALLAVWRRSVRRWFPGGPNGQRTGGLMQPDLEHLHHRLSKAGLSTRKVAVFLYTVNAALVFFGLLLTLFRSHSLGILLIALLAIAFVMMRHLAVIELRDTGNAILHGLRRPTHATVKALFYPVWDMVWLSALVALSMILFDDPRPDFWRAWFLDLPVWVTPTFTLLAWSRTYVTAWTRVRLLDVLMLASLLVAGGLLSLGIALLIDPGTPHRWLLRALVIGTIGHPAIIAVRLIYRLVEELVTHLRNKTERGPGSDRVLLYGGGRRCQLFLKERSFALPEIFATRTIVGLVDDEHTLHGQWVYGYPVLGGIKQLPHIIQQRRISRIVITADLLPETLAALKQVAFEHAVSLSSWRLVEEELPVGQPAALSTLDSQPSTH